MALLAAISARSRRTGAGFHPGPGSCGDEIRGRQARSVGLYRWDRYVTNAAAGVVARRERPSSTARLCATRGTAGAGLSGMVWVSGWLSLDKPPSQGGCNTPTLATPGRTSHLVHRATPDPSPARSRHSTGSRGRSTAGRRTNERGHPRRQQHDDDGDGAQRIGEDTHTDRLRPGLAGSSGLDALWPRPFGAVPSARLTSWSLVEACGVDLT